MGTRRLVSRISMARIIASVAAGIEVRRATHSLWHHAWLKLVAERHRCTATRSSGLLTIKVCAFDLQFLLSHQQRDKPHFTDTRGLGDGITVSRPPIMTIRVRMDRSKLVESRSWNSHSDVTNMQPSKDAVTASDPPSCRLADLMAESACRPWKSARISCARGFVVGHKNKEVKSKHSVWADRGTLWDCTWRHRRAA